MGLIPIPCQGCWKLRVREIFSCVRRWGELSSTLLTFVLGRHCEDERSEDVAILSPHRSWKYWYLSARQKQDCHGLRPRNDNTLGLEMWFLATASTTRPPWARNDNALGLEMWLSSRRKFSVRRQVVLVLTSVCGWSESSSKPKPPHAAQEQCGKAIKFKYISAVSSCWLGRTAPRFWIPADSTICL